MELSAWRAAVPYGACLQPIHLNDVGSNPPPSFTPAVRESPPQSTQNPRQTNSKTAEASSNGTPAILQPPEKSTDAPVVQDAAQSTAEITSVTVIPPFACEWLNDGQQLALNVGGPVWAMDWLPSTPAANAAAVAAALTKSKQKKARRPSRATKKGAKRGKENNKVEAPEDVDGETTAASNDSAETEGGSKMEWRFLALATHPPCQVEDGKVVKATPPDHYYDVPESARNLIQIWAVPVQRPEIRRGKISKRKLVKPRMVYAIDHESGVAWDLQWCPLVKKFPKANRREKILGVLAACFGDGSMRVFEIPVIPKERLQVNLEKDEGRIVEKNVPVVVAKLPRIMQLSVQWSPHSWNMLLTGGSDGSVSLWNIKSAISESDSLGSGHAEPEPIEPQRRFQDADTIGKQEAFDWGCGWVAIRSVAWSPFDEYLFATTGNDSVFKMWDVREPRVCLRSHRIRSTWGLALQWMDQTSIQISGDQGSVYMYDVLSGSYQKLHFHPQIDSPVWDLQFARRGAVSLLVSSCASGSIRAAPAKKLYRAPQNCVELCRLSGQKDSSIENPFKSLTVSFEKRTVLGTADSVSLNTREFCERDAALHRLRLSSNTAGDYPCFLAAGGHAGLVILMEMQETLDTLIPTFFMPSSKKIGRPKKIFAGVGNHHASKKSPAKQGEGVPATAISAGRKARTLGSFAKAKGMHTALSKYTKKSPSKSKAKVGSHAKRKKKSFIQEDGEVEVDNSADEEEEPEFEDEDEEDDESDLSLVMEDNSDDDRVSVSEDDVEEEDDTTTTNENPEEARLMKEYQLDLSEEDAILLALQMSKSDDAPPVVALENGPAKTKPASTTKPATKKGKGKKRARPVSGAPEAKGEPGVSEVDQNGELAKSTNSKKKHPDGETECKASTVPAQAASADPQPMSAESTTAVPVQQKAKPKQAKKKPTRKPGPKTKRESPMLMEAINQAIALQAFEYQLGMSEEDALKEALRLSEMGEKSQPSRANPAASHPPSAPVSEAAPTPTQPKQMPATPRTKGPAQQKQKKVKDPMEKVRDGDAVPAEDGSQQQRPQTPRRLEFSPLNGSEGGNQMDIPATSIGGSTRAVQIDPMPSTDTSAAVTASPKKATVVPSKSEFGELTKPVKARQAAAVHSSSGKQKKSAKSPSVKTPKKPVEKKTPASASAAARATPEGKKPAKRSRSTSAKPAGPAKKRKKTTTTTRGGRRNSSGQGDMMSEEDALLLALKMSEIEY